MARNVKGQKVGTAELEAIRAYDSAKESTGTPIPNERVLRRLGRTRA